MIGNTGFYRWRDSERLVNADAIAQMYPGELEQISELGIRLGEALMKQGEMIRDAGSRTVT